ncbi:uncharacterized protein LOC117326558 [Pecten maximus]|uniref:uncharacterized protein LOC117326558 n=1 Tax=Pecten maximus TaxID=6579 RepID=UPI0014589E88|nr:uncharacterized protein LOC117326558 [Pecten maximus]
MSHRTVCRWVGKFSAGQQQLKDAAHPGRPATTTTKGNIEKIRNILKTDARFTNIRVVIPESETEDCHFLELDEEEKTEQTLEEEEEEAESEVTTNGSPVMENTNTTDEKACLYGDDEPVMTDEVKTTVESWCGARKIRHLTRKAQCQDVPQDGSQQDEDLEETESGTLVRRKRSWFWGRCRYHCYWISRRVRSCWYGPSRFFYWRIRYFLISTHYYCICGRNCGVNIVSIFQSFKKKG